MERNTAQRQAILKVLQKTQRPLSLQEILALAEKQCPGIGIATIYRNVKSLLAEELVVKVELPANVVLYEAPKSAHHHHFSCLKCLRVFDIDACETNFQKLLPKGFKLQAHEILLSGYCQRCAT